jgi:hypothetical protein
MHTSLLRTCTWSYHYNATQAIHSDLSQRVVRKCFKIEPFLKLSSFPVDFAPRPIDVIYILEPSSACKGLTWWTDVFASFF